MNKYFLVALSVAGGLLSSLAWTGWCTGLILLISFIPFFLIEDFIYRRKTQYSVNAFFTYTLPGFVIFSILTLGWIREASMIAAVCVIMGMTFLMAFTVWMVHLIRLRSGNFWGITALVSFWLAFEYLCLNVDIITPWINLGNGLAKDILFIQWYDITGVAGGTLWIVLSNLLLSAFIIKSMDSLKRTWLYLVIWGLLIIIPSLLSISEYYHKEKTEAKPFEVVIVQPDFDPYKEKFSIPFKVQLEAAIKMAGTAVTEKTEWLLTPETTIDDPVNEDNYSDNIYLNMLREFARNHQGISIVVGMTTYKTYLSSSKPPTRSARFIDNDNTWYDHFNSAVQIDTGKRVAFYHKSKLVPGIEKQFVYGAGKILSKILPKLGGYQWGYGIQKDRGTFRHHLSGVSVGPVICYESIYGDYLTEYVKNGANAIFIITNDGWWKNTNGYKQHFYFASIRAIETRRPVARSANTGISGIIDKKGRIIQKSEWWSPAVLKGEITPGYEITPYVKYGDYMMFFAAIISILVLSAVFVFIPLAKKIMNR
jgi:apolipoprotein N-acyltransferase